MFLSRASAVLVIRATPGPFNLTFFPFFSLKRKSFKAASRRKFLSYYAVMHALIVPPPIFANGSIFKVMVLLVAPKALYVDIRDLLDCEVAYVLETESLGAISNYLASNISRVLPLGECIACPF